VGRVSCRSCGVDMLDRPLMMRGASFTLQARGMPEVTVRRGFGLLLANVAGWRARTGWAVALKLLALPCA